MGLNILLQKLDGTRHPDWDDNRFSGDREILEILIAAGIEDEPGYDPWKKGDAPLFRPINHDALDAATWPPFNEERWAQLRRILREEPDYWLYWSV
jgi:hypothetical protein